MLRHSGLFSCDAGNSFAAQSLVNKMLASDNSQHIDLINKLIERKNISVLAEAAKIIKNQMEELLQSMKTVEKEAIDGLSSVEDKTVREELTACYNAIRNGFGESFSPRTTALQHQASIQILKGCASKLVPLAEQGEILAGIRRKIEDEIGNAALEEKTSERNGFACLIL